ncbi:MAG: cytochrome d ubiquinol oxidase subunit II [Gammaproteobacteria bacterium]|nr:cytochrome d ubiquinol oxidase subunit II [Gammaproteobacteria bacterium]
MIFDYETLKVIWWLFVGILLIGFAITDGFDLGVGTLLPFVGKNDKERRVIINSIGPTWDGNQVWFITAGGAVFAAWPMVYAAAFSGFYIALLLVLFALFFRPVGFDYRSKLDNARWRSAWDWGLFAGGAVPALVFGVAFGNLLLGVPFHYDEALRPTYTGSFFELLNPFALLTGVVSLSMLIMHGAIYLQLKTEAVIQQRAQKAALLFGAITILTFTVAGIWTASGITGYVVVDMPPGGATPNVLEKVVEQQPSAWLNNYGTYSWMTLAPLIAYLGIAAAIMLSRVGKTGWAFIMSSMGLSGIILTAGFSMFPFIMPSSSDFKSSLTVWDATSSHLTLTLMFWAVLIFLPVILVYTSWVYRVMRGKVTEQQVEENQHTLY